MAACNTKQSQESSTAPPVEEVAKQPERLRLYLNRVVGTPQGKRDSVRVYESAYLETTLSMYSGAADGSTSYRAGRKLEDNFKSKTDYKFVWDNVTNEDGSDLKFKSSTDFLNYMADRGYDLVSKKDNQYSSDYIFKRKE
jgi:hypothetical protein